MTDKTQPKFDAVVVRLSALGDVVLTTGVLEHWRDHLGLKFAVITRERFAPVFTNHPAVTEIIAVSDDALKHKWMKTAAKIAGEYSSVPLIDLHGNGRTWILSSFWKGKVKRYPKYSFSRRMYRRFRSQWAERRLLRLNVPQRYSLALLDKAPSAKALLPHIFPTRNELAQADAFLAEAGVGPGYVALHPYATHDNKAWPREHWVRLVEMLDAKKIPWLTLGMDRNPFLHEMDKKRDLTNMTSLRATIALLARARTLISGDSGPMHLAGAVGTPTVALFGPTTNVWGFYPEGPGDIVLEKKMDCRPCSLHGGALCKIGRQCLAEIEPEQVLAATLSRKRL